MVGEAGAAVVDAIEREWAARGDSEVDGNFDGGIDETGAFA